jgi:FtsP/CotA-like multicopper oxidase with cupredoxin domain
VEAVVTGWQRGGTAADSVELFSDVYQSSSTGQAKRIPLGWLVNRGLEAAALVRPSLAGVDAEMADSIARLLADDEVNRETIRFQLNGGKLQLNGASYDHDSLDTAVPFGQTQEWTLINETNFLHTFHIHQTDFVVTHINGRPQPDSVHLDNVFLGIHQANGQWLGDTVVIRFKYKPIAEGPFVYHCHVLGHEDAGMMANMCVYDPRTGVRSCRAWFPRGPYGATADAGAPPAPAAGHSHGAGGGETRER